MPQTEQLGITELDDPTGFTGVLDKPWGSGVLRIVPVARDCFISMHKLVMNQNIELYEFPGDYACVCSMSEACTRSIPEFEIKQAQPVENILGFSMNKCTISFDIEAGESYDSCCVMILPGALREIGDLYPGNYEQFCDDLRKIGTDEQIHMMRLVLREISNINQHAPGGRLRIRAKAIELLAMVAEAAAGKREAERARNTRSQRDLVARVEGIIQTRLSEKITIDDLARELYVSRNRLCSAFKEETGKGIGEYTRHLKVNRAKDMLAAKSLGVSEIARELGYPRQSSFNAMFKSETGMSPSAWRAQIFN